MYTSEDSNIAKRARNIWFRAPPADPGESVNSQGSCRAVDRTATRAAGRSGAANGDARIVVASITPL